MANVEYPFAALEMAEAQAAVRTLDLDAAIFEIGEARTLRLPSRRSRTAQTLSMLSATRLWPPTASTSNNALRTQRVRMDRHQADAAEQAARCSACK
jgi:hypothetical protein